MPFLSAKNKKLFTKFGQQKLGKHDGLTHESRDPSRVVTIGWFWCKGGDDGGIFLAHFGALSIDRFNDHSFMTTG